MSTVAQPLPIYSDTHFKALDGKAIALPVGPLTIDITPLSKKPTPSA